MKLIEKKITKDFLKIIFENEFYQVKIYYPGDFHEQDKGMLGVHFKPQKAGCPLINHTGAEFYLEMGVMPNLYLEDIEIFIQGIKEAEIVMKETIQIIKEYFPDL